MTLYTYVPLRTALVDLMVDQVLRSRDLPAEGPWQDRIRRYAESTVVMYRTHPWLSQVPVVRPPLGPGTFRERADGYGGGTEAQAAAAFACGLRLLLDGIAQSCETTGLRSSPMP
ncbi:TetR/AcrR family transcriptional regulator C-terminal domain-containing protein [Actinoplanes sp. NPDC051494]|uniref:TetR/AcrR family transcriptional regulator C-terminal domain-containing protein n=1 Tax=Actinoplanes sp. NPDC051494 TaxID=3363907 RepID=UPI0037B14759